MEETVAAGSLVNVSVSLDDDRDFKQSIRVEMLALLHDGNRDSVESKNMELIKLRNTKWCR